MAAVAALAFAAAGQARAQATAHAAPAQARGLAGIVPDVPTGTHLHPPVIGHATNLPYNGGPVLHSNRTHVIFWQPSGSGLSFEPGYVSLVSRFLVNVAADSHLPTIGPDVLEQAIRFQHQFNTLKRKIALVFDLRFND